jgi:hypothetical protein
MKRAKFVILGAFVAFASLVPACSASPDSSESESEVTEPTAKATLAKAKATLAEATSSGEAIDPGLISWCNNYECCAVNGSVIVCCILDTGACSRR